jgi:hypothetical protein
VVTETLDLVHYLALHYLSHSLAVQEAVQTLLLVQEVEEETVELAAAGAVEAKVSRVEPVETVALV